MMGNVDVVRGDDTEAEIKKRREELAEIAERIRQKARKHALDILESAAKVGQSSIGVNHSEILEIMDETAEFYTLGRPVVEYLIQESKELAKKLSVIDGFVGAFGVGFPFYTIDTTGAPIPVAEISRFLSEVRVRVTEDMNRHPEGWYCPRCHEENHLENLKKYCKQCSLVILKPRVLLSAIPDLDLIVVVQNPNGETEQDVGRIARELGYTQSDTNIHDALLRTREAMAVVRGSKQRDQSRKIPVDIHVWSSDDVLKCMAQMVSGEERVMIEGRSLHMEWEKNALNFWFDFVFSLTPLHLVDQRFQEALARTRRHLAQQYHSNGSDELVRTIARMSERAARLVEDVNIQKVLLDRVRSWL